MGFADTLDSFFKISARGSTIGTEVKAGVITFLTMSYILLVNPNILSRAGLDVEHVVASTALSSALASIFCGVLANFPLGMAPGMGVNAYLVFSQVLGMGVSVHSALACCSAAAVIVAVLALIRALSLILAIVPNTIKMATVVGMGLLLAFIGLQTAQVVIKDKETMVGLGNLAALEPLLALAGLAVVAALHYLNVPGSILIGIVATALGFWSLKGPWPHKFVDVPHLTYIPNDFKEILAFDGSAWSSVIAYCLVIIFDVGGVMFGVATLADLLKDGSVPGTGLPARLSLLQGGTTRGRYKGALQVAVKGGKGYKGRAVATCCQCRSTIIFLGACIGTAFGAFTGTTPLIIAAETAVGIKEGGRTGLMSVVIGICFIISMFVAPFLQSIPGVATAPVLVLVGAMMMGESKHIDWAHMNVAVPAFLTMVIQPFTFSIANGIYAGLLFSILLFFLTGDFIPFFKAILGFEKADAEDLETSLLEPDAASAAAMSRHSISRTTSVKVALESATRLLSNNTPYNKTYDMLLNTKGEEMPPEGEPYRPPSRDGLALRPATSRDA